MARTPKRRALGNALRNARESKGLTLRQLGELIDRDSGVISRYETGDRTPKIEQVAQILTAIGINGERYDEIVSLAHDPDTPLWVATTLPAHRQQLNALLSCEQSACRVTAVAPLLIPGLLQTSDYIRSIMTGGGVSASEIETRVAIRIGRREALTRRKPVRLIALVDAAVLHRTIGGHDIMLDQLRHLHEVSKYSNIMLRIVPHDCGWHPALEGPFDIIESETAPVVHIENRRSGLFIHEEHDVTAYQEAAGVVSDKAMSRVDSLKFIQNMIQRMEAAGAHARVDKVQP